MKRYRMWHLKEIWEILFDLILIMRNKEKKESSNLLGVVQHWPEIRHWYSSLIAHLYFGYST